MPLTGLAIGGAAAAAAKSIFGYNRENFMEDRDMRMRKEFQERKMRVVQGGLWRQDVRDFVSLTERKMKYYLLVNVLLLGFNVNLWCEGRLPEHVPAWLMMGNQISIGGSFMFLLLTVWLSMHAAVAAQSYQTRILTQLVRLPVPTWQELEACRTYGSDFERLKASQMFRVPFVTGSQERVAKAWAATPEPGRGAGAGASPVPGAAAAGSSGPLVGLQAGSEADPEVGVACDPWGLERRGDDLPELGQAYGEDVAKLRHIKIMRQAAVYWQTYDAFARVSMSIGVNQLLLAMSYYILGYALVQVSAPVPAFAGVIILVGMAEVIARLDLTLAVQEQRLIQILHAFGPLVSCLAAYHWGMQYDLHHKIAQCLAPLAFFSHGGIIALTTLFLRVKEQENGAMLPLAFQGVLFLDPFAWVQDKPAADALPAVPVAAASPAPPEALAAASASEICLRCPSGHGLRPAQAHLDGQCDTCMRAIMQGDQIMECWGCNWILCGACSSTNTSSPDLVASASTADAAAVEAASTPTPVSPAPKAAKARAKSGSFRQEERDSIGYYAMDYLQRAGDSEGSDHSDSEVDESEEVERRVRPALASIRHDDGGHSLPTRPDDAKPTKAHQDLRLMRGAPRAWDEVSAVKPPSKAFFEPSTFMPAEGRRRTKLDDLFEEAENLGSAQNLRKKRRQDLNPIVTGHDNESPGIVPWMIFRNASLLLVSVWVFAGIYSLLRAADLVDLRLPWLWEERVGAGTNETKSVLISYDDDYDEGEDEDVVPGPSVMSLMAAGLSGATVGPVAQEINIKWPYHGASPRGLSCDSSGKHFLVTDGLSAFTAQLRQESISEAIAQPRTLGLLQRHLPLEASRPQEPPPPPASLDFEEPSYCPSLMGEALEDTALICGAGPADAAKCEALVLHRRGRRLGACDLTQAGNESRGASAAPHNHATAVSRSWLRREEESAVLAFAAGGAGGGRAEPEEISWVLMDPNCATRAANARGARKVGNAAAALQGGCASVGTSHGRVAQLQHRVRGEEMIPADILEEDEEVGGLHRAFPEPGVVRAFSGRYFGVLQQHRHSIRVLDASRGGLPVGTVLLPMSEPIGSFCAGGGYVYLLGEGPNPGMWRVALPQRLSPRKSRSHG